MTGTWQNNDGLYVKYGRERASDPVYGHHTQAGNLKQLTIEFQYDAVPGLPDDLNNDGTADGFSSQYQPIPARSAITRALLHIDEAFTSGGSTTLTIGLAQRDGTVIDADGIDAAIAKTAMDADGDLVVCDGALVGATIGANDGFVYMAVGTGPYTAGKATLTIEYMEPNQSA